MDIQVRHVAGVTLPGALRETRAYPLTTPERYAVDPQVAAAVPREASPAGACRMGRGAVQLVRADAVPRRHSLPILLAMCQAPGSGLANEWPTNDQCHDRRVW
jgi:hypothetical protein